MSNHALNITLIAAIIALVVLLVREWLNGTGYQWEANELRERLAKQTVTFDRMYYERNEAQAIADHAIGVITEARGLIKNQQLCDRLNFLTRSFVDRRQELANEQAIAAEIERLTGDKK